MVTLLQNLKKLSILLNYLIVNLKFYSHGASTQLNLFAGTNEKFSYLNDLKSGSKDIVTFPFSK